MGNLTHYYLGMDDGKPIYRNLMFAFGEFRSVFGQMFRSEYAKRPKSRQGRQGFGHLDDAPAGLIGNSIEALGPETIKGKR